jgi:hypothetical protein
VFVELLVPVNLDEVVAIWLAAEAESARFGPIVSRLLAEYGHSRALLTTPNPSDPNENVHRLALLREYRGFDQPDLSIETYLEGAPVRQLAWRRVRIGAADAARMEFINWDFWVEVTGGTRLASPLAAAKLAEPGGPDPYHASLRDAFLCQDPVPEIILVDSGPGTRLVILEGHQRATAMAMAGETLPAQTAILGRGTAIADQWL